MNNAYVSCLGAEARKVEVQADGNRHSMRRGPDGWWTADVAEAKPGAEYGFMLDGEGPFPDPRSPWQPAGVHGLSRLLPEECFAWTDRHFQAPPLASAIVYELHMGTLRPAGTFPAAVEKLEHLGHLASRTLS